ncbi:hypothetical protein [Flavihumibacter solisilvae]|uniref:hypothetical protein n=1 Tax=Flavihumibacter solisilvae TaxID=1349421 RepID=UPI0019680897|nr:hypothetical protein [Flavihumibacter solisilvae]
MQTVGQYQIEIYRDETFDKHSNDNVHLYDHVHFKKDNYVFPTMIGVKVFKGNNLIQSAIIGSIGGGTGIHSTSVIYENERLLICCSDSIFCLSIPDLILLWQTRADQATCFEIYKYQDNYIVHGELEISRLDVDGKILWQRSGADIFTTISGEQAFKLTDNLIIAKDFEDRVYKFDYDGNELTDMSQFS